MNRAELYLKSSGLLLKAYQNKTLLIQRWGCCAVANLIVGNRNYKIQVAPTMQGVYTRWSHRGLRIEHNEWGDVLTRNLIKRIQHHYKVGAKEYRFNQDLLRATGYSFKELRRMVKNFDNSSATHSNLKPSLQAALDTLRKFHGVGFGQYSRDLKKRLVRQNRLLQQLPKTYEWLEGKYTDFLYPKEMNLPGSYWRTVYWRVRISIHAATISNKIFSHLMKEYFTASNLQCIHHYRPIQNQQPLRHEMLTSYTRFNCIINRSTIQWSDSPNTVRYAAEGA